MVRQPDDVLAGVGQALDVVGAGDRSGARHVLEQLWAQVGPDGDALHRCAVAHTLADLQDDPLDELCWDRRALDAARVVDSERMEDAGVPGSPAGLLPSLHLNLADVLLRLGRFHDALQQVELGAGQLGSLPDDGYRQMITAGLDRVRAASISAG